MFRNRTIWLINESTRDDAMLKLLCCQDFMDVPGDLAGPFTGAVIGGLPLQSSLDQASQARFGTVAGLAHGIAGQCHPDNRT